VKPSSVKSIEVKIEGQVPFVLKLWTKQHKIIVEIVCSMFQ
jgi:hypothetical protein